MMPGMQKPDKTVFFNSSILQTSGVGETEASLSAALIYLDVSRDQTSVCFLSKLFP